VFWALAGAEALSASNSLSLKHTDVLNAKNALGQEARRYDSKEGIGRVESGTETENNALGQEPVGRTMQEQLSRNYYRGAIFCHTQIFHKIRVQLIFLG
jgi:hypothetical protein